MKIWNYSDRLNSFGVIEKDSLIKLLTKNPLEELMIQINNIPHNTSPPELVHDKETIASIIKEVETHPEMEPTLTDFNNTIEMHHDFIESRTRRNTIKITPLQFLSSSDFKIYYPVVDRYDNSDPSNPTNFSENINLAFLSRYFESRSSGFRYETHLLIKWFNHSPEGVLRRLNPHLTSFDKIMGIPKVNAHYRSSNIKLNNGVPVPKSNPTDLTIHYMADNIARIIDMESRQITEFEAARKRALNAVNELYSIETDSSYKPDIVISPSLKPDYSTKDNV